MGKLSLIVCLLFIVVSCTQECITNVKPTTGEDIIVQDSCCSCKTETTDLPTIDTETVETETEGTETVETETVETEDTETEDTETEGTESIETDTYDVHTVEMECRGAHEIWACPESQECILHETCAYDTHYCWKDPDDNRAYCLEYEENIDIDAYCKNGHPFICAYFHDESTCEQLDECTEDESCRKTSKLTAECYVMPPH